MKVLGFDVVLRAAKGVFGALSKEAESAGKAITLGGPASSALGAKDTQKASHRELININKTLKEIKKGNQFRPLGDQGIGQGRGGNAIPSAGGGGGNLKLFGMMSGASMIGSIAGSIVSSIFAGINKLSASYRGAVTPQLPVMQQLGFNAGSHKGFFAGDIYKDEKTGVSQYVTGEEQRTITSEYARNAFKKRPGTAGFSEDQAKAKLRNATIRANAIQTATGIDVGELSAFAGKAERFSTNQSLALETSGIPGSGSTSRNNFGAAGFNPIIQGISVAIQKGMFAGGRFQEFFGTMASTFEDAVKSGMTTSVPDVIGSIGRLSSQSNQRINALVPGMMQGGQQMFGTAARMEGGPAEGFAFYAVRNMLKGQGKSFGYRDVQSELAKGMTPENLNAIFKESKRFANEDTRDNFLMKLPMFNQIRDPNTMKEIREAMDAKGPSMTAEEATNAINDALKKQEELSKTVKAQEIIDTRTSINDFSKAAAEASLKLAEMWNSGVTGVERFNRMIQETEARHPSEIYDNR